MVEEILSNIYRLKIPLPGNPLQALNSYLIRGKKRCLLVDTGFNWLVCKEAQMKGLASLGVDWSEVDFFITHAHSDHSGLVYELANERSRVFCSRTDADLMHLVAAEDYWDKVDRFLIQNGFPREKLPWKDDDLYFSGCDIDFTYVQDGETIDIGEYSFICIFTPGHSPGHMCLYEPKHRFLISGDHILSTISSNIIPWNSEVDFLGHYLHSLDKINSLDVKLVLPGHRELIYDCNGRIAELKQHHEKRMSEILEITKNDNMDSYQVAQHIQWDLHDTWEEVSNYQKWFATGETIAHLHHLANLNKLKRLQVGSSFVFKHFG